MVEKFGDVFLGKFYVDEIQCCNTSANKIQKIAVLPQRGVGQTLGTGIFGKLTLKQKSHLLKSSPFFILYDEAALIQQERHISRIHVSLSHKSYAISLLLESSANTIPKNKRDHVIDMKYHPPASSVAIVKVVQII